MTKSQKIKISIELKVELPQSSKGRGVQYVHVTEPPPPSVSDPRATDDPGSYPSHQASGTHGHRRFRGRRSTSVSRGRAANHDSCSNGHGQHCDRSPKGSSREGSKSERPGTPARSNASSSPAGSVHRGDRPGPDMGDQARTETLETPLDEQIGGERGSPPNSMEEDQMTTVILVAPPA
ncbi:uncharacterized protein PG986_005656 [Apiospora aurea]|uniref:Uncharacterized protein n=1 Tax=Apiospora aurea TaxID=335848 RepID=A0ABR1QI68_9PEZI